MSQNKALQIGDIMMAPLGVSQDKKTKVRIKEIQESYAKVEYIEKKVREELGSKPFLIQTKNLSPVTTTKKIIVEGNRIKPEVWVSQIMKEFPNWINSVFLPYRVQEKITKKEFEKSIDEKDKEIKAEESIKKRKFEIDNLK